MLRLLSRDILFCQTICVHYIVTSSLILLLSGGKVCVVAIKLSTLTRTFS